MCCPLTLVIFLSFFSIVSSGLPNDDSFLLAGESLNTRLVVDEYALHRAPFVIAPVPDQELTTLSDPLVIPLLDVFSTNDNSALRFEVAVNNDNVAEAEISSDTLYVRPGSPGNARIRIVARDDENDTAVDAFRLTVRENNPPQVSQDVPVRDQVIIQGNAPFTLNLFALFNDPDGDLLSFRVTSSDILVSDPEIERGVLTAPALRPGITLLTVSADDLSGGQASVEFALEVLRPYPVLISSDIRLDFGPIDRSASYRLIALPGNQSPRVEETTDGTADEDWISFAADSLIESGLLPFDESEAFRLKPGRGLWFLSASTWEQPDQLIPSVPLNQGGTYRIPLHDGWNIISNPFDIDLLWEDVSDWNNISQALWSWRGNYAIEDTFYAAIHQGEAFYFYNEEGRTFLDLPYPGFANPFFSKTTRTPHVDLLRITARNMDGALAIVEAGFSSGASTGADRFDYYAPPSFFAELSLHIENTHHTTRGRVLARDIQPAETPLKRYTLLLHAAPGEPVQLLKDPGGALLAEQMLLINNHDGASYNISTLPHTWITPEAETTPLTLLIGERSLVEEEARRIQPQLYTLKQNFPNPFKSSTDIEFSLPAEQHVTLKVFDITGRLIDVLVEETRTAGLHRISWSGQDKNLANGIYLYRLNTDTVTLHRTMVLLK